MKKEVSMFGFQTCNSNFELALVHIGVLGVHILIIIMDQGEEELMPNQQLSKNYKNFRYVPLLACF